MEQDQSVQEWARRTHFAQPLRWGEVEAGILARDPMPDESGGLSARVMVLLGWLWLGLLVLITWGAAAIGFAMVAFGSTRTDVAVAQDWLSVSRVPFVAAILVQLSTLHTWWRARRRGPADLVATGVTVLSSAAAYVMLAWVSEVRDIPWLSVMIVTAGALAAVAFALVLTARPEGRQTSRKPPRRGPRNSRKWAAYRATRERVLEILTDRGLVNLDEADRQRVLEMPLGYWDELDGLDEREWRRVLELRLVGWRDFDESDKRPWPPVAH